MEPRVTRETPRAAVVGREERNGAVDMKPIILLSLLAAAVAVPVKEEADAVPAASSRSSVSESADLGQEEGWSPLDLNRAQRAHDSEEETLSRSLDVIEPSELSSEGSGSSEDAEDSAASAEDGKTSNSYLSPLYAPAPGGYGSGSGYGYGYGPSIYILPIVLPPPGGHGGHPVGRHVVTETGHHESHHFSGDYRPVYAGSYGVPPIYIPKEYGVYHGGHGAHPLGHPVGHPVGHTTVHHEDKTIIRDIKPPVFKA